MKTYIIYDSFANEEGDFLRRTAQSYVNKYGWDITTDSDNKSFSFVFKIHTDSYFLNGRVLEEKETIHEVKLTNPNDSDNEWDVYFDGKKILSRIKHASGAFNAFIQWLKRGYTLFGINYIIENKSMSIINKLGIKTQRELYLYKDYSKQLELEYNAYKYVSVSAGEFYALESPAFGINTPMIIKVGKRGLRDIDLYLTYIDNSRKLKAGIKKKKIKYDDIDAQKILYNAKRLFSENEAKVWLNTKLKKAQEELDRKNKK